MNRLKNLIEAAKPFDALYQPDGPISHWDRETDDRAIFGVNKKTVLLGDFRRLRRALAEAATEPAAPSLKPIAWARRWYADGEKPVKVRNPETGRMALPFKFKLLAVTEGKCLETDVPLVRMDAVEKLVAALQDVRDNAREDSPAMWQRVDEALAPFEVAP